MRGEWRVGVSAALNQVVPPTCRRTAGRLVRGVRIAALMGGQAALISLQFATGWSKAEHPTHGAVAESLTEVGPRVLPTEFKVPELPRRIPRLRDPQLPVEVDTVKVLRRLQRAADEVRLVEVWSLDPSISPEQEKSNRSRPYRFHEFHSIGREEMKDKAAVQKLLFAVTLAIANGPDESMECFEPRHGLRIHGPAGFIDLVLCYECLQGELVEGKSTLCFSTSRQAEREFDAAFRQLGLRKADPNPNERSSDSFPAAPEEPSPAR